MIAAAEVLDVIEEAPPSPAQYDRLEIFDYVIASTLDASES